MKAPVASTLKVIGSSSAMVSAGPMPGSTPTAVPRKQPSSAQPRLPGVSALEKPRERPAIGSISAAPGTRRRGSADLRVAAWSVHLLPERAEDQPLQHARADIDAQPLDEAEPDGQAQHERQHQVA